ELHRAATALYAAAPLPPDVLAGRAPDILAAGVAAGGPQAAVLAPSLDRFRWSRGAPALYAVGWWTRSWLDPRRELDVAVPATLRDVRDFALALGRKMMACILRPAAVPIGFP